MWATIWGVIWLVDTYHLSMSQKALSATDPATGKECLGRVRILRSKEESIRREYGLGRPYSDSGRPLGLDSRTREKVTVPFSAFSRDCYGRMRLLFSFIIPFLSS